MTSPNSRARRLAVLLHADVVGSTRLVQRDEGLAHGRITEAFGQFAQTIRRYDGVVHEIRGDALVAELPRASDAVNAAIAFQLANTQRNACYDDGLAPEMRVGISLGEVIVADGTMTGPGIVLAQRVEQLAVPGGVCITTAVHEAIPGRLPFAYQDLGERSAKGFDDPVRVYAVELRAGKEVPSPESGDGIEPTRPHKMAFALPAKPSVAVLPFINMSADPAQEYFVDGMTEDLQTDLSKLSGLFVISRDSTFAYKRQAVEVRQVAEELGVRYVVKGSVRRAGEQVRINAQLIDATNGAYLWSERYDRGMQDIFALQDEVIQRIVSALRVKVSAHEQRVLSHAPTGNIEAYECWLRGYALSLQTTQASNASARQMFERAIELDPEYAGAYASLGFTHWMDWILQWRREPASLMQALAIAQKAAQLDDTLAMAHQVIGEVYLWQGRHDQALAEVRKAIALDPNETRGLTWLSFILTFAGQPEDALAPIRDAMRLHPQEDFFRLFVLGFAHTSCGQHEEALAAFERSVASNANFLPTHAELLFVFHQLGRLEDARVEAAQILRLNPEFSLQSWAKSVPFKARTTLEQRIACLRQAGLQ